VVAENNTGITEIHKIIVAPLGVLCLVNCLGFVGGDLSLLVSTMIMGYRKNWSMRPIGLILFAT
jgi:hypothetical protein